MSSHEMTVLEQDMFSVFKKHFHHVPANKELCDRIQELSDQVEGLENQVTEENNRSMILARENIKLQHRHDELLKQQMIFLEHMKHSYKNGNFVFKKTVLRYDEITEYNWIKIKHFMQQIVPTAPVLPTYWKSSAMRPDAEILKEQLEAAEHENVQLLEQLNHPEPKIIEHEHHTGEDRRHLHDYDIDPHKDRRKKNNRRVADQDDYPG